MTNDKKPKRAYRKRKPLHAIHAAIGNLEKRMEEVRIAVRILDRLVK